MRIGRFRQIRRGGTEVIDAEIGTRPAWILHHVVIAFGDRQLAFYLAVGWIYIKRVLQTLAGAAQNRSR